MPPESVQFEWDPDKHARNLRERGFGFDFAALIFIGNVVEWPDLRHPYPEKRVRVLGMANGVLLHVVYTNRGSARRIISARPASRKERRQWQLLG